MQSYTITFILATLLMIMTLASASPLPSVADLSDVSKRQFDIFQWLQDLDRLRRIHIGVQGTSAVTGLVDEQVVSASRRSTTEPVALAPVATFTLSSA
ncbi:unnamed protein product [Somion occarium]